MVDSGVRSGRIVFFSLEHRVSMQFLARANRESMQVSLKWSMFQHLLVDNGSKPSACARCDAQPRPPHHDLSVG
jgi:hypothetical protein